MASLSKIIDVHSHPVLAFGERAPVGVGKQPDWSVEGALSYMEEYDISACVLSAPASANNATGQEARDIARRTSEVLAEIISKHPNRFGAVATLPGLDTFIVSSRFLICHRRIRTLLAARGRRRSRCWGLVPGHYLDLPNVAFTA